MKKFILAACLSAAMLPGISQVPQMINYQGLARNTAGQPLINQNIQLRLSVRDSSTSGPVVYSETRAVTTNQFGIFAVVINGPGATSITGNFPAINWSHNQKFLQVEIDPAGGTAFVNLGAAQLYSVPFALHAANGGLSLPHASSHDITSDAVIRLTNSSATGTEGVFQGISNSTALNATAIRGVITSTAPGDFSAALRGINNGTADLGTGVWGSHNGGGMGVYGTSLTGSGLYGLAAGSGTGVFGKSQNGKAGNFEISNAANASNSLSTATNGSGMSLHAVNTGTGRAGQFEINNAANANPALYASTNGSGFGIHGLNTGTGRAGQFEILNTANAAHGLSAKTNGSGSAFSAVNEGTGLAGNFEITNAANASTAVNIISNGTGTVLSASTSGTGRAGHFQITSTANASNALNSVTAGTGNAVNAENTGTGRAGYFRNINAANSSNALEVSTTGTGRAGWFQVSNAASTNNALLATSNATGTSFSSINTGTGSAGLVQITNTANSNETLEVITNGTGSGIKIQLTHTGNGSRGIDVLQNGVGPGVFSTSTGGNALWGITSSISAAGVIGDNTFGEAVVGRNRGGNGVGAIVGRNDSSGYGVRGFNTENGIGVLGQAGISGGTGRAGRFENLNASNTSNVFEVSSNSATANLAVFIRAGNKARIDATGKGFFNGGTQASGADVAEAFDVIGDIKSYEPGDVLVISTEKDRTVLKSSEPYSILVAGVYATKPGVLLTEHDIETDLSDKLPMGVLGVLPTKVCNEGGAIKRGDILVTSSQPGVAMKGDLHLLKPGQMIGKALQEFDATGIGKINVLVSIR